MTVSSFTPNFSLNLVDFDSSPWDDDEHDNWRQIDAIMAKYMSIPGNTGLWANGTAYVVGAEPSIAIDEDLGSIWQCAVAHTSAASGTFAADRAANPTYWVSWTVAASLAHETRTDNPHVVTKTQVGLGNVDNVQQQPLDATLTAWAGLATAADKLGYFDGNDSAALMDFVALARTMLLDPPVVVLERISITTAQQYLEFDVPTAYHKVSASIRKLRPVVDNRNLLAEVRLAGGAWQQGANDYEGIAHGGASGSTAFQTSGAAAGIANVRFNHIGLRDNEDAAIDINCYDFRDSAVWSRLNWHLGAGGNTNNTGSHVGSVVRQTAQDNDRVRIFFDSGDIETAECVVYGWK